MPELINPSLLKQITGNDIMKIRNLYEEEIVYEMKLLNLIDKELSYLVFPPPQKLN